MVKPNKNTRRKIYEVAIKIIKDEKQTYVCIALNSLYNTLYGDNFIDNLLEMFPEFAKQAPYNPDINNAWWPHTQYGKKQRINALRRAIKLTK